VTGTAVYREQIDLPPGARFEATIENASRADALADVLARTAIDDPLGPSIAFSVPFDAAKIDPRFRYTIRATIKVDGKLWFTSDATAPVIAQGRGTHVDLLLRRRRSSTTRPRPGSLAACSAIWPTPRLSRIARRASDFPSRWRRLQSARIRLS